MQTSHKLTRIFVALFTLIVLSMAAMAQTDINVSDQKAGSVLVYPYYNSNSQIKADTRITLSNLSATQTVAVHLFFIDKNCSQADTFACLTPNASIAMKASEFDPEQLGWILAVAVNRTGIPYNPNTLIGNAFVSDGDYVGNYGAEAFRDITDIRDEGNMVASFAIQAPTAFAIEIQSPLDATGQKIVTVGLRGDIVNAQTRGAAQRGTGVVYNGNEKPFGSFSPFLNGGCRAEAIISATSPRVPLGLSNLIPSGQVGTLRFNVGTTDNNGVVNGGAVGLLMTPKNNKWSGIRTLHKTAEVKSAIAIPSFLPGCVGVN
ncbi:MAG: hypothetical protein JST84_22745 [Acidobacteria bacterium]|nr:hypothetical protein [Acidobacteriota bacterium]